MAQRKTRTKGRRRKALRKQPLPLKVMCVVKRGTEKICHAYDERKVYGSVYAACSVVGESAPACEKIADAVARRVTAAVRHRRAIRSDEIAHHTASALRKHNRHAAFMYETHRDIS